MVVKRFRREAELVWPQKLVHLKSESLGRLGPGGTHGSAIHGRCHMARTHTNR
jgi:hypothetical protein